MVSANWLLIALAFVLGLVLTFALTIRRVEREVPTGAPAAVAPAAPAESTSSESASAEAEPPTDTPAAGTDKDTDAP